MRIRTIAEPRMWPASASVTWMPCATSCSIAVRDRVEHRQRQVDVVLGVQRVAEVEDDLRAGRAQQLLGIGAARALGALGREVQDLVVLARALGRVLGRPIGVVARVAGRPLGELGLELGRVEQHEPGELRGSGGADDGAAEALVDEQRQQAAVVEVGVGEDDGIEGLGVDPERHAVAHRLVAAALEHAAVDEDAGLARVHEVARTRHGPRPAEEGELHVRIVAHRGHAHRYAWHDGGHVPRRSPRPPRGRVPRRARRPGPARRRAGDRRARGRLGPRARGRRRRARRPIGARCDGRRSGGRRGRARRARDPDGARRRLCRRRRAAGLPAHLARRVR